MEDYVVEIDRKTGRIVKTFDINDIIPMDDGKSENWTSYDFFHNNSVWYDEKTNSITLLLLILIIRLRNLTGLLGILLIGVRNIRSTFLNQLVIILNGNGVNMLR